MSHGQNLSFSRVLSIFWFGHSTFCCNLFTYDVIHICIYNTQTQTNYVIKDRKQENKEKRKWKHFPKPYENCSRSFWKKIADLKKKKNPPRNLVSYEKVFA